MKKILLLVMAMLTSVGMAMAQDVYTSGFYTSSNGQKIAAVYKNGQMLHESSIGSGDNISSSVVVDESNGDVYWVRNSDNYGDVFKNGNYYLNNESGTHINDLCKTTNSLYSGGYKTVSSVRVAVVWKDDDTTPFSTIGDGVYDSEVYGVHVNDGGYRYYCGYQNNSSGNPEGKVWKGSSVVYTVDNSYVEDVFVYNDNVYYITFDLGTSCGKVYRNSTCLYTLNSASLYSIYVDGQDIFVCGYVGSSDVAVWRNGEVLYQHTAGYWGYLEAVQVTEMGVYYAGANGDSSSTMYGVYYKDGDQVAQISPASRFYGIYVTASECEDASVRTLPYYEGFEMGDTEWSCWTKTHTGIKEDHAAYWHRCGAYGDYTAGHYWGPSGQAQESWLISPKLFLQPGRDMTRLSFWTYEGASNDYEYEGVWISTTNTNPSSFTEIWTQDNPASTWTNVVVDLSDYRGQAVYIAFKYSGTYAHSWFIDNISVTEDWSDCGTYSVPYAMDFDGGNEPGYCWYILDNDHTGGNKCWQYSSSENCAYHPWGQQNMPQEGWLFSPAISLSQTGLNYTLSFNTKSVSSGPGMKNSVWINTSASGVPDPSNYVQIWEEDDYSNSWSERTIDLTAYAGQVVSVAFKYEGTYAHSWYLDDIEVTAGLPQYNINVVANNAAWGTVTGGGTYDQGASCTITATPSGSYVFLKWTKDGSDVSTNQSYTFTVTENATYTAVFGEPSVTYYTINTNVNPSGAGTVTGGGTYASGSSVVLTANPGTGWHFTQWNDGNTDNPRTITVTGDATYVASFAHTTYTLTVTANPAEGGTVTGGGTYNYGTNVTLTATANEGYSFLTWNDGETMATRTVTVTEDASYEAAFIMNGATTYTITAVSNDLSLGSVTGGGVYPEGMTVTLTAIPSGDAVFVKWDDNNTDNPRTITVSGDATYTAYFEMPTMYTITVVSLHPEMGSVSGGGSFPMGAEVTIQANPFGGFYFDGWNDNNYDNPRTITVTGDATYSAKFSAQQAQTFALTVTCNPMQGYVDGSGNYLAGTEVTILAVPYEGFAFDHWNDGVTDNPRTVTVDNNLTLVAFFKATGVDENGETVLAVYPNPAKESIRIDGLEANSEVVFYNALGMMVKTVVANADQEINVSDLAAGLYLVRCGSQVFRFVKE